MKFGESQTETLVKREIIVTITNLLYTYFLNKTNFGRSKREHSCAAQGTEQVPS
jgi:hypothetical protein